MKNERTSARVAKIAAKVLAMSDRELTDWIAYGRLADLRRDIRALAASCLTQAPSRSRKPPARSPFYPGAKGKRRSP